MKKNNFIECYGGIIRKLFIYGSVSDSKEFLIDERWRD